MATINEQVVTGRKFRKLVDEATKLWQRISFWTKASDVEFDDAKTAEIKVGAIDGITDSLASTSSRIAASAKSVNQLSNDLAQQPNFIYDSTGKITGYKTPGGADTVFPFSNLEIEEGTFETYVYGGQTQINTVTFKKSFNNVLGFGACGNSNSNNHLMGVGIISSLTNKKCSFYVHNGGESGYVKIKWVAVGKV